MIMFRPRHIVLPALDVSLSSIKHGTGGSISTLSLILFRNYPENSSLSSSRDPLDPKPDLYVLHPIDVDRLSCRHHDNVSRSSYSFPIAVRPVYDSQTPMAVEASMESGCPSIGEIHWPEKMLAEFQDHHPYLVRLPKLK